MSRYENERDDDRYERDDDRYERYERDDDRYERYERDDDRYGDSDDRRYASTPNTPASTARYAEIDDDYDGQAFRLYMAALDRTPDPTGLANWTNLLRSGADLDDVARGFVTSTEFQSRYGDLDDSEYVTQLYLNVLNRSPDASGQANWIAQLESGATRESVLIGFSESTENRLQAEALVNGVDYQAWVG
ncbi:DUF4214 domain-containing protein [Zwartia panacis]|uniref:DUF4214 domain-containing protein n=1 Tax=Zwartia panacis TaxID=2683345 RepID=UPI0025B38322|nr:DUF4214 domain-containing protein [Zwartia panacis]MDN4015509.1 DUF4214 domain-containing protein [Zwartia panacis]